MSKLKSVIVRPNTSNMAWFEIGLTDWIYSNTLVVVLSDTIGAWSVLNSSLHEEFSATFAARMKTDSRYNPSTCFATFPMPGKSELQQLTSHATRYHVARSQTRTERYCGLSKLYDLFHDSESQDADIRRLRQLHVEMDNAVAVAYGWTDLDLGHGFHKTKQGVRYTISEPARREVLARLLKLNHERYAEEVRQGLHEKKKSSGKGRAKEKGGKQSPGLFND